jgi:hypothetical protein
MIRASAICIVLLLIFSPALGQPSTGAGAGGWIEGIPAPQEAIQKISGTSELDTKSRQGAALYAISQLILRMTGNEFRNPPRLSPREAALLADYQAFYGSFSKEYADHLNRGLSPERLEAMGRNRPSTPFADLEYRYRSHPAHQREAFTAIMGAAWIKEWYEPLVAREAQQATAAREQSQRAMDEHNQRADELRAAHVARARARLLRIAGGIIIAAAGIAWAIFAWRPTRLDTADPFVITGRRARGGWGIKAITGIVSDSRVYTTTTRHFTRERFNDSRPDVVRWHDVTTSHREFVVNTESRSQPFHLLNTDLLIGDGHTVSCAWPERGNKARSELLIVNHTTQTDVARDEFITPAFMPIFVITLGIGIAMHLVMGILALVVTAIVWKVIQMLQSRRFRRQDLSRLVAALNARAAEAPRLEPVG